MGRVVSKLRARLLHTLRGQVVGGLLAVLILAFQLYLGVIPRDVRAHAWWSIAWPYLILSVLFILWHSGWAWYEAKRDDREYAMGQAALLWTFEAQAKELLIFLEKVWHHWHNAGEVLLHPLDVNDAKSTEAINLQIELRDFKLTYGKHLQRVSLDIPAFTSKSLTGGYPSSREYIEVLYDLREHTSKLGETAQRLYDTGIPLSTR
jgi:hypothetical protein